jgi:superfamily II DNA or RNA helicase
MYLKNLVQNEALFEIENHKRCGVAISMGVGKTRLGLKYIFTKGINLIVVPKKSVIDSWILEKEKIEMDVHLEFVTYRSLNKKDPSKYDVVVLDECHNLKMSHIEFLDNFNGNILGLTGTPPINKAGEKFYMVNKYCPIVYTFTVDDAASADIINDYIIYVHMIELSDKKTLRKNKKNGQCWYTSETKDYDWLCAQIDNANSHKQKQFSRIMRMKSMMEYQTKELYAKKLIKSIDSKCIVFANTVKQADRLCQHSYHSKNKLSDENLEMFSDGRINTLSCVLQLNEGINIPNLKQGIILHAYGNERKSAQRIGRLLRLNPNDTAICHILCYNKTIDMKWISDALLSFDMTKIRYING